MLTTSASLALGFAFVLMGGVNVWLVLEAWSRVKATNASSRMLTLHRIGGYLFIALFCVMTYFMVARLRSVGADTSATVTIHLALAMVLSPLLFIKVLIARYYRSQHGLLMPIGLYDFRARVRADREHFWALFGAGDQNRAGIHRSGSYSAGH